MTNKDLEEALYIASHLQDFTEFKVREVIEGLVDSVDELMWYREQYNLFYSIQAEDERCCNTCKYKDEFYHTPSVCDSCNNSNQWRSKG